MFNKLIASGPQKRKTWTPGAVSASLVIHVLLLLGAVYASVAAPVEERAMEEEVTFMEVEVEEREPEPPPPPEAPPPEPASVPPPPQGFQELIPPIDLPDVIPEVDLSHLAVDAADFSGVGIAGGTATGVAEGTPQSTAVDSTFVYEVAVLDSRPSLSNVPQVQRTLARLYPRMMLNAGIEGTVQVRFVVQPDGTVDPQSVEVTSTTHEQFSSATVRAIEEFRFVPGRYRGQNVNVLIEMPIQWRVGS